jgi:hypothetical protein
METTLSYPIGRFDRQARMTAGTQKAAIDAIAALPERMRAAVEGLTDPQLDTEYRPGGWTVRQLVHHVADSHMNGYIRMKLALTEDHPTIKVYDQDAWAGLPDARLPIDVSLTLLEALHARWSTVLRALHPHQFARTFNHPELGPLTVDTHVHLYAWHSKHHVAHVTALRLREHW